MPASFDALELQIQSFSSEEKALLARRIKASEIEMIFTNIKEAIAQEAKNRVQSKIALTFNHGYGNGSLFNSIYYKIDGDSITISSTKSYFAILNAGFAPFDMKQALLGRTVKMRLPGGRMIFRKVGNPNANQDPRKKTKPLVGSHNWIHPGIRGANIYQVVNQEMEVWINDFVTTKMHSLIEMARGRDSDVYATSQSGKQYYNRRDDKGHFVPSGNLEPSPLTKLLAQDVKNRKKQGPAGMYSPLRNQ